jgi:hypothetical protein
VWPGSGGWVYLPTASGGTTSVGSTGMFNVFAVGKDGTGLPTLSLGDSEGLRQGQIVLAFGAPLGLDNSATMQAVEAGKTRLSLAKAKARSVIDAVGIAGKIDLYVTTPRITKLSAAPPKMILRNAYNDSKAVDWLAARIHVPVVLLPYSVGGTPAASDLFKLFDDTINRLTGVTQ